MPGFAELPKILVTGDTGFVGQHVVKGLEDGGYDVLRFRRRQPTCDVSEPHAFDPFSNESIYMVVHLAARTFVPDSWASPADFYQTNVVGTARALEFCRRRNAALIFLSSYVYGDPEYLPIDERHPTQPNNPYAISKLMAEQLCQRHAELFDLPVTIFRPGNLYGSGQDRRFLIPSILAQMRTRHTVELTDPRPKRDMIYVGDVVSAIKRAVERPAPGCRVFNLGSNRSYSVADIADSLVQLAGYDGNVFYSQTERPNEIFNVILDGRRAHLELGWERTTDLPTGLARMLEMEETRTTRRHRAPATVVDRQALCQPVS